MATQTDSGTNVPETETTQHPDNSLPQPKRPIYPEVSSRYSGLVVWLGLAFVVMVFLVQHFSGYS